jgi:ornithine cyclodeaminase/alanine dehydrogenase-like protein (mu-crystallin family)
MDRAAVEAAVSPERAVESVREAFIAHARGEWSMPPKVYVTNYPAGDFRAMPALGGGHALLKWITSFPGNPARGLPTVTGIVLVSDAATGELQAVLDAASVTALRTGAAAVLAAETLGRTDAETAAVIGAGVNGRAAARAFLARGRPRCGTSTLSVRRPSPRSSAAPSRGRARRRSRPICSSP